MNNKDISNSVIFPRGDELSEAVFSGRVYLNPMVPGDALDCSVANVTFEPGCRNNWHTHPGGQVLLVTGGQGWYQEEGKDARKLQAGDCVIIPRNVKHWHGAARDSWFVHLAIGANTDAGPTEWLEPVSEKDYTALA